MNRPRPALVVLAVSAIALTVSVAALAAAGPVSSVDNVGSRPTLSPSAAVVEGSLVDPEPQPQDAQVNNQRPSSAQQEPDVPSAMPQRPRKGKGEAEPRPVRSAYLPEGVPSTRLDATVLPSRDMGAVPKSIFLPSIGVTAKVERTGLSEDGQVDVPQDVSVTGWYEYSQTTPSSRGSSVIVGHRDGRGQGPGAFYDLADMNVGDTVVVTTVSGVKVKYEVVAREAFDKKAVPLRELFSSAGPHRLTLITCGGPFDENVLGYTDNIVVTAVLK